MKKYYYLYFFLFVNMNLSAQKITSYDTDASEDTMQAIVAGDQDASWIGLATYLGDVPSDPFQNKYIEIPIDLKKSASEKGWGFTNDLYGNYDKIAFLSRPKVGSEASITLYQGNSRWWKGVSLKNNKNFDGTFGLKLLYLENDIKKVSYKISNIKDKKGYLLLSKAKDFGDHKGIYIISNTDQIINQNDLDWFIGWVKD